MDPKPEFFSVPKLCCTSISESKAIQGEKTLFSVSLKKKKDFHMGVHAKIGKLNLK